MNPKKILLIEDDKFIFDLYKRVLTQAGYEVMVAQDGEEGIKMAQNQKFDLILLDIMLPKKNGVEVLRDLKGNDLTKNIPVMVLSNLGQEDIIKDCLSLGAVGYLLKVEHLPQEVVGRINEFFNQ